MREICIQSGFAEWRESARRLLASDTPPGMVIWRDADAGQSLLPMADESDAGDKPCSGSTTVPKGFIDLARLVACHRDDDRWALLYRVLWRLTHGERHLLQSEVDEDIHRLLGMHKSVRRDIHKMHAFVRFRRIERDGDEHYLAWHRPDHHIVREAAAFFAQRFNAMRWSILTPDESVHWDREKLTFGEGVARPPADDDELESLWLTYYRSIFNPARIKLRAMRKEMPVRHWATLPETALIPELIRTAPQRVEDMVKRTANCPAATSAAEFLPQRIELPVLRTAVQKCRGCDLYCNATQAVFGEGLETARVMFVGEQPGDQEDLAGRPFVGPAGKVFDDALEQAGIQRADVYVTNAVKHFKFEPRGKRRIHAKPSAREISACRPWLESEISALKPELIVCLGATAAQSLMGREFRITKDRGRFFNDTAWAPAVMATIHPSAILRMPDESAREEARRQFIADLKKVAMHDLRKHRP